MKVFVITPNDHRDDGRDDDRGPGANLPMAPDDGQQNSNDGNLQNWRDNPGHGNVMQAPAPYPSTSQKNIKQNTELNKQLVTRKKLNSTSTLKKTFDSGVVYLKDCDASGNSVTLLWFCNGITHAISLDKEQLFWFIFSHMQTFSAEEYGDERCTEIALFDEKAKIKIQFSVLADFTRLSLLNQDVFGSGGNVILLDKPYSVKISGHNVVPLLKLLTDNVAYMNMNIIVRNPPNETIIPLAFPNTIGVARRVGPILRVNNGIGVGRGVGPILRVNDGTRAFGSSVGTSFQTEKRNTEQFKPPVSRIPNTLSKNGIIFVKDCATANLVSLFCLSDNCSQEILLNKEQFVSLFASLQIVSDEKSIELFRNMSVFEISEHFRETLLHKKGMLNIKNFSVLITFTHTVLKVDNFFGNGTDFITFEHCGVIKITGQNIKSLIKTFTRDIFYLTTKHNVTDKLKIVEVVAEDLNATNSIMAPSISGLQDPITGSNEETFKIGKQNNVSDETSVTSYNNGMIFLRDYNRTGNLVSVLCLSGNSSREVLLSKKQFALLLSRLHIFSDENSIELLKNMSVFEISKHFRDTLLNRRDELNIKNFSVVISFTHTLLKVEDFFGKGTDFVTFEKCGVIKITGQNVKSLIKTITRNIIQLYTKPNVTNTLKIVELVAENPNSNADLVIPPPMAPSELHDLTSENLKKKKTTKIMVPPEEEKDIATTNIS